MEEKDNMKKKEKRPTYEPPRAVDLSDSSVSGMHPPPCESGPTFQPDGCTAGKKFGVSPP